MGRVGDRFQQEQRVYCLLKVFSLSLMSVFFTWSCTSRDSAPPPATPAGTNLPTFQDVVAAATRNLAQLPPKPPGRAHGGRTRSGDRGL